jgi:hypothetical protein
MRSARDIATFDRAGRLVSYFDGGAHYWRGLSGAIVRKQTDAQGRKQVQVLNSSAAMEILRRACRLVQGLDYATPEVREVVDRALRYDPAADEEVFRRVYGWVGILPPDQYLALVLQVSTGCAWNRCTFCRFYAGQTFHRRSPAEFRDHARAVLDFLGDSLLLRRSVFLGDADVLTIPTDPLAEMIETARDLTSLGDFHAFAEAVSIARRPPSELAQLAALGLRRLYIGAETGSDPLLESLQKRSRSSDVAAAVSILKEAGLNASLIFLAGLGHPGHPAATARLVETLPLGPGDLVYLSRLWGGYGAVAEDELRTLQQNLAFLKTRGVKVAPYDIRQFAY